MSSGKLVWVIRSFTREVHISDEFVGELPTAIDGAKTSHDSV
jgi:hypothetical protein